MSLTQDDEMIEAFTPDRSGPYLWRGCSTPISRHGHTRQAYRTSVTLAERFYRKADQIVTGLDFYLDPRMVESRSAERIRALLQDAIAALENHGPSPASQKPTTQST